MCSWGWPRPRCKGPTRSEHITCAWQRARLCRRTVAARRSPCWPGKALYTAQLLNGELPHDIDSVFQRRGGVALSALGQRAEHRLHLLRLGAALHRTWWRRLHRLGEMLDVDPFTILLLRGRSSDQVMAALRAERAGAWAMATPPITGTQSPRAMADPPLAADPERFWALGEHAGRHANPRRGGPRSRWSCCAVLGTPEFARQPETARATGRGLCARHGAGLAHRL